MTAVPELAETLGERIRGHGTISFAEYMQAALYDPQRGYYMRTGVPLGDYFTSVSVHPALFGALLARHLDDVWHALGRPRPFHVVELGSGDGQLARQILEVAGHHPWSDVVAYVGIETSPTRRALARQAVPAARFHAALSDLRSVGEAAFVSNEFFDALPVRLVRRGGPSWIEERVGLDGDRFVLVDRPAEAGLRAYAARYADGLPDGGRLEVRVGVDAIYAAVARLAQRCVMASIDFGGTATEVHGARLSAGTLLAYRRHRASEEVLADPGRTDLAAHVDFSELADVGRAHGLTAARLGTQADFLTALGIGEYLVALQRRPELPPEAYAGAREAVFQLVSPSDLGRFRVLVQARGADLTGLRGIPATDAA